MCVCVCVYTHTHECTHKDTCTDACLVKGFKFILQLFVNHLRAGSLSTIYMCQSRQIVHNIQPSFVILF